MNDSLPTQTNYQLNEFGIEFHGDVDFEEWVRLGEKISRAGRSLGFIIGDWINYGESRKDYGDKFTIALKSTGFDYQTLLNYSRVARKVQMQTRVYNLSFEHHRKVAHLPQEEQRKWLSIASKAKDEGSPLSTRRLAKSILLGRVAQTEDMIIPHTERRVDTVHPHINGIVSFWSKLKNSGWLDNACDGQIRNMLLDLKPVLEIAQELRGSLEQSQGRGG